VFFKQIKVCNSTFNVYIIFGLIGQCIVVNLFPMFDFLATELCIFRQFPLFLIEARIHLVYKGRDPSERAVNLTSTQIN